MTAFIYCSLVWLFATISLIASGTVKTLFLGLELGVLIGEIVWFLERRANNGVKR